MNYALRQYYTSPLECHDWLPILGVYYTQRISVPEDSLGLVCAYIWTPSWVSCNWFAHEFSASVDPEDSWLYYHVFWGCL